LYIVLSPAASEGTSDTDNKQKSEAVGHFFLLNVEVTGYGLPFSIASFITPFPAKL
jgi:hypothetical protein